ncbi:MAG: F0F1 ATP synthase subunit gamma, partial [Alphaproteobacteria bacterium]|nr:F0F1 ATP synthase subunit gamma [Alphaproteobacteria bacterium]
QMVAASKLRRAQEAAEAARPYAQKLASVIAGLASGMRDNLAGPRLLIGTGSNQRHLVVVMTADRGLCGAFNSNIVRLARRQIGELVADGKQVRILCVGRKGRDQLRRQYGDMIVETIDFMGVRRIGFSDAQKIGDRVLEMFESGEFDVCTMIYSQFKSIMSQQPVAQRLIPAPIDETAASASGKIVYDYEPDETAILADLLPRNISVQIFRGLLENVAGEFGAKMSAMDSATRNAGDVIDRLTLDYNRTRQAMITKELIEIISGAEAV